MDRTTRETAETAPPRRPSPGPPGGSGDAPRQADRGLAALLASIDRLDDLELEAVEPATTFGWP